VDVIEGTMFGSFQSLGSETGKSQEGAESDRGALDEIE
jgi:hypothetical protein